jgi:acetyltransferase-like isoleucine patch superfamily enzyme
MSDKPGFFAHPTAIVESVEIGDGTKVWHFAHVRAKSKIGKNCNIGKSVYVDIGADIGNNVKIQNFVSVYKGVIVEDDVFIGPSATFTNDLYPRAFIWDADQAAETRVCKGASIGANATIVCGVTIGEYSMVAAGSVVAHDVPAFSLALGNPARHRGWVCICGKTLSSIVADSRDWTVYRCDSCGKELQVSKPHGPARMRD